MSLHIRAHEEDPPLASTIEFLSKELPRNIFWHDLKNWLEGRIALHQRELENATDMFDMRRSQGIIQNCRDILDLPEAWISELQAEEQIGNDNE
jgi:hypothetical protein